MPPSGGFAIGHRARKLASLLRQTLEEEKATDKKLTQLSGRVNIEPADSEESKGNNRPSKGQGAPTLVARFME